MEFSLERLLKQAVTLLEANKEAATLCLLDRAVDSYPDDPRGWQMRGGVRHRLGDTARALDDLEQARALGPLCPSALLALIDCHRRQGQHPQARQLAEELARDLTRPPGILAPLACTLGLLGEFSTALTVCESIVEQQPIAHTAWFGIGFYRSRLDFSARQIIPFVERAFKLDPTNAVYAANVGLLLLEVGESERGWSLLHALQPRQLRCPSLIRLILRRCEESERTETADNWRGRLDAVASNDRCRPQRTGYGCCVALPCPQPETSSEESRHETID